MQEVAAFTGFTRIESPGDITERTNAEPINQAPITRNAPEWVPVSVVRGEGIFLQFNEEMISAWSKSNKYVLAREGNFLNAHRLWMRKRNLKPDLGFPGIRYILLHSFSHALMRQFSMECGYSAASIKERIYARAPSESDEPMAGILIYTAVPDSEGTLGGLISLGSPKTLAGHINQVLEDLRICASDPLCAENTPGEDEEPVLHGAACHACLFAPETSCERGNRYLDRSLLVQTFDSKTMAFFDQ